MFPFSKWRSKEQQNECIVEEKKLLKDEWKKLKEKAQVMEEQNKLDKGGCRSGKNLKQKKISRARMNYMERRKSDEELWMKTEVRSQKIRCC